MEIAGKIKTNELLCNVNFDTTQKDKLRLECCRLEDKVTHLDFRYAMNHHKIQTLNEAGNVETAKMLVIANEEIKNQIKSINNTLTKLYKFL